ncbi:SpaA isopeptide-forming pilin-related protein [Corynebacterium sp. CCUG 70398]|uniref:SpaA isopeptide-forming pilin-related protein n=1 Tax=Corynebacterium sp. CCUG 70398 TaxID=2823891 RepID=UPI00210E656A|nr:SpaA isopeptide-forming pilin-related protein [Corynebacterium sp. CCUG 70398]MCQ4622649.1 hypothetical protein [Corynebacterium sp. CCUG 70398]
MTKRSHTRVRGLLCSVSVVGALFIGSGAPVAVSQTVTEPVSEEAAVSEEGGTPTDEASGNGRKSAAESQAPDGPEPDAKNQTNDVNAARFGDVIAIPKGTNAEGSLLYTLTSKVSSTDFGEDEYIRLIRQDSGAPVKVTGGRLNASAVEVSTGVDDQNRQILALQRPAQIPDSNIVEVDIEVEPGSVLTKRSWRLEISDRALDGEQPNAPELSRNRLFAAAEEPRPDMSKIPEYMGGSGNFVLGTDPSFELTEIVPEEDDGKVATIRFTFEVDGMNAQSGPFNELRFNPRGMFNLEKGAKLEGLDYLWLNDSENTNPEHSLNLQKKGIDWVKHSVDEKGEGAPLDVWSSTHFLIANRRPVIKNGDTLTVRYKLTREKYEVEPDSGLSGTPTENTYWVNTETQFTRYDISPDMSTIRIGRQFPVKEGYGDIAVTKDGKFLYAVKYLGPFNEFFIDKYDARTGAHVGRGSFKLGPLAAGGLDLAYPQLNALTFDYDGNLIFATPKATNPGDNKSPIWKLDPSCVKPLDEKSVCNLGTDVVEMDLRWPKGLTSAGDFFVGADGSLYGAATTATTNAKSESPIVRWAALEPGYPAKGRATEGVIVGNLPRPTFGMGRFGDYILSTQTDGTHDSLANSGLVWSHFASDGKGGYVLEGDELQATVESTAYGVFKPNQSLWGATSIYDSGPVNEVILRIEKEVRGDRVEAGDQFQLGAYRDPAPPANKRTYLEGSVMASSPATGLQDQVAFSYVQRGESYGIFEGFRYEEYDKKGNKLIKNLPKEHAEKYFSSLKCVEGNEWSANGTVVETETLSDLTANSDRESRLTIPSDPNLKAVTCRFSNSTEVGKTSLAVFKMADKDGQNNLQLLDGAKFALHEKDEKAAGGLGTKVSDIVPNPDSGYSVGDLEFDKPYLLVETQAPPGYLRLSQPIEFMITRGQNGRSQLKLLSQPTSIGVALPPDDPNAQKVQNAGDVDGVALTVVNVEHPQLPKTGGPGVHRLGALGLMLLALGGVSLTNGGGRRRLPRMSW